MLGLCIYVLLALAIETFFELSSNIEALLHHADTAVCCVFMADFFAKLFTAKRKFHYLLTWGWIDFLSSIPLIGPLRFGRLARLARILRLLRGFRSIKVLTQHLLARRAESASTVAALTSLLLVVFCSIAVLHFEQGHDSSIASPEDALWWAFTTVTTVGYGDTFPVTSGGRIVAVFAMCAGVGLFATLSGLVATWFLAPTEIEQERELEEIRIRLANIETHLETLANAAQLETAARPPADRQSAGDYVSAP
jgi:voltage-gated potassium channel